MEVLETWNFGAQTLRAGLVTTAREKLACFRLRYREYHDIQGEIPKDPERLDIDWADECSTLLCTTLDDDPRPIGTMRLIHCQHGCLLTRGYDERPANFSGIAYSIPERSPASGESVRACETVEGSRFVARVVDLDSDLRVIHSNLLMEAAMSFCRDQGIRQIIGALKDHQFHNLRRDGLPIYETIERYDGGPHLYHSMNYRDVFIPVLDEGVYGFRRTLPTRAPRAIDPGSSHARLPAWSSLRAPHRIHALGYTLARNS